MAIRPLKGNPPISCDDVCHRARGSRGGTDYAVPVGTPVYATFNGHVARYYNNEAGNYLCINHENGHVSYYMHLSRYVSSTGDYVTEGQLVAYSGGIAGIHGSGSSTGPHLHANVDIDGIRYGMEEYLALVTPASLTPTKIETPSPKEEDNMKLWRYTSAKPNVFILIDHLNKKYRVIKAGSLEDQAITNDVTAGARRYDVISDPAWGENFGSGQFQNVT